MHRAISAGLLLTTLLAADWPAWRGPNSTGVSSETALPTQWSASENIRWKVPLEGAGVSAPIVVGDQVILTASDGRLNDRLHVWSYHRDDGKLLWHTRLFGSSLPEWYFQPGGMAVPTPASDGQHVYALFGSGDLACLDLAGKPVWIRSLAQEYGVFRNRWGMAASPILVGDLLVVLVDHWGQSYLLGIDKASGKNRWKTDRPTNVNWTSPYAVSVNGKTQIVTSGTFEVRGYDAATGKELWQVAGMQEQCIPSPVSLGNLVFCVSGRKGRTVAVKLDGSKAEVAWESPRGAPNIPSALALDGHHYLIDDEGFATCLDAKTGAEVYRERVGGRHQASPVAGAGRLYFTSLDGVTTVVRPGLKFEVLVRNKLGETIVASPALANGRIYLRGDKHLYCVGDGK
jgi:outer membrane protein assembly factor BamB